MRIKMQEADLTVEITSDDGQSADITVTVDAPENKTARVVRYSRSYKDTLEACKLFQSYSGEDATADYEAAERAMPQGNDSHTHRWIP